MRRRLQFVVLLLACSVGCSDTDAGFVQSQDVLSPEIGALDSKGVVDAVVDLVGGEDVAQDLVGDTPASPDCEPGEGCFGELCESAEDCLSSICATHLGDDVCSKTCDVACPEGWSCKLVAGGADAQFVCVSNFSSLCLPCTTSTDCSGDTPTSCLSYPDGTFFCGGACDENTPCPEGYVCEEAENTAGVTNFQCINTAGICDCSSLAIDYGLSTSCEQTNANGTCTGVQACTANGWTECDAGQAAAEICNGLDDDCDGLVDAQDPDLQLTACEQNAGACEGATKPAELCAEGAWAPCQDAHYSANNQAYEPADEGSCDGLDNDCDGDVDEGLFVKLPGGSSVGGVGLPCGAGACAGGVTLCDPETKALVCTSLGNVSPEVCNGVDDDCDGLTDAEDPEDLLAADAQPCEIQDGLCAGSMKPPALCVDGAWAPCEDDDYSAAAEAYEPDEELSCDGLDNDCDGAADEDFELTLLDQTLIAGVAVDCGVGACAEGQTACLPDGTGITCAAEENSSDEVCNGVDDDCDGAVDAADESLVLGEPCELELGVCEGATKPANRCQGGAWTPCLAADYGGAYEAGAESLCDGADNDCDGAADEDFVLTLLDGSQVVGVGASCGAGACAGGVTTCDEAGKGIVCPTEAGAGAEICNGIDDDCDGLVDAADPDLILDVPCELQQGTCAGSIKPAFLCADGAWAACGPGEYGADYQEGAELSCDGSDNDCDGEADEEFSLLGPDGITVLGAGKACGVGACADGTTVCDGAGTGIVCSTDAAASAEICNALDDDCDGLTDVNDADMATGELCELQVGVCAGATKPAALCEGGSWSPCGNEEYGEGYQAGVEASCDGSDNDCDGTNDEDFELTLLDGSLVSGVGTDCGAGVCAGGVTACDAAGAGIVCAAELAAGTEICNGNDDDCDGLVDAADPDLILDVPCELQQGTCAGAIKPAFLCADGAWAACGPGEYGADYQEGAELSCDGLDNDCDGGADEDFSLLGPDGVTVLGAGSDCGVGACAEGTTLCDGAGTGIVCSTGEAASAEICNALDDDCDGLTDANDADLVTGELCELQAGVCAGATKPAALCEGGSWSPCGNEEYGDGYQAGVEVSCDGSDNDCDGTNDEDFGLTLLDGSQVSGVGTDCGAGVCAGGVTACDAAGTGIVCAAELAAGTEICNGNDDDCDGLLDASDPGLLLDQNCELQSGICSGATKPAQLCVAGSWQACSAPHYGPSYENAESSCDGADNDCDGTVDDGANSCGGACSLGGSLGGACNGPDGNPCTAATYVCSGLNAVVCEDAGNASSINVSIQIDSPTGSCSGQSNRKAVLTGCGCPTVTIRNVFKDNSDGSAGQVQSQSTSDSHMEITWDDSPGGGDCDLDLRQKTTWSTSVSGGKLTVNVSTSQTGYDAGNSLSGGFSITNGGTHLGNTSKSFTYDCNP